jgi:mannose-6-phosphate isomerase-like protein (cupin superfamily)
MQVVRAAEAPRFQLPGVEFAVFASPSSGSKQLCAWRLTVDPGHGGDAPHSIDADELFIVLSGSVRLTPDGEALGAGDALVVPAGEPIAVTNLGDEPAVLHVALTAGFTATTADGASLQPPWSL